MKKEGDGYRIGDVESITGKGTPREQAFHSEVKALCRKYNVALAMLIWIDIAPSKNAVEVLAVSVSSPQLTEELRESWVKHVQKAIKKASEWLVRFYQQHKE